MNVTYVGHLFRMTQFYWLESMIYEKGPVPIIALDGITAVI